MIEESESYCSSKESPLSKNYTIFPPLFEGRLQKINFHPFTPTTKQECKRVEGLAFHILLIVHAPLIWKILKFKIATLFF